MKRIIVTVDFTLEVPDDTDNEVLTMDFDRCTGKEVGFSDYDPAHPAQKTAKLIGWGTTSVEDTK